MKLIFILSRPKKSVIVAHNYSSNLVSHIWSSNNLIRPRKFFKEHNSWIQITFIWLLL